MDLKISNKEQLILEVAERLFIEKGYSGTKTTEIAGEAGVNNALLHYYYRTKENLFNRIFEQKVLQLIGSFSITLDRDLSIYEKIKAVIETHFDFISENPKLPFFILREIIADKNRKSFILKNLLPIGNELHKKIKIAIRKEVKTGNIRPVNIVDLLLNIVSLNVFALIAAQIFYDTDIETDRKKLRMFLEGRKRNNVKLILNSIKP